MKTKSQILLNLLSGGVSIAVQVVLAMFMVPFLLRCMGKEGYGLIGLLGVIVSMAGVVDLGLRSALGRELSEQVARKSRQGFNELISTAFVLYLVIGVIGAIIVYFLAPWLIVFFKVSPSWSSEALWMLRLYGPASIILSFIAPVFSAALSSNNRFDVVNSINVVGGILTSLLLIVCLLFGGNPFRVWVWVKLASEVVVLLIRIGCMKRYCDDPEIGVGLVKPRRLIPLFQLGGFMYMLQLTQALSERSDPLVVSYFFGPAGVALYQPGGRLSQMIRPVVLLLANQMHPLTTRQHVDGNMQKMQRILVLGTKYTLLFGSLFSAGMLVYAMPFAKIWLEEALGPDYKIAGYVMMGWALVDLTLYAAGTQFPVLLGMKRLTFLVWTQIPTAFLNILVSIYFVGFSPLGIAGVLIATILVGFIRRPILIWYTAKVCGLRPKDYFVQAYIPPLICFLCCLLAGIGIRVLINPTSLVVLLLSAFLTSVVWGISCWFLGFSGSERKLFFLYVKQFLKRVQILF